MRRWIAAALTASAVLVATPAYAQTTDPVKALKKQFVAGQGVQLRETTTTWLDGKKYAGATREGQLEFGKAGIAGAETTRTPVVPDALRKQLEDAVAKDEPGAEIISTILERIYLVSVGNKLYINGGIFSTLLPDDKLWVFGTASNTSAAYGDQVINVFEPATLKRLLATATSKSTAAYRGAISFADLYAVSPTFREQLGAKPKGQIAKTVINWQLYLDDQQLTKRLKISLTLPVTKKVNLKVISETRYFDWGGSVKITAPPADQAIDAADLLTNPPPVPTVVDKNYVSVPPDDEGNTE